MKALSEQEILFHIGYPKTATSWLQKHVFTTLNPDVNVLSHNSCGPSTFGQVFIRNIRGQWLYPLTSNRDVIRSEFHQYEVKKNKPTIVSHEGLSGGFNKGAHNAQSIGCRIHYHFPNAKILIVVREQRSMLRSNYSQSIVGGNPKALRSYLTMNDNIESINFEHLNYVNIISFYQEMFGVNKVLVLPYEMFVHDTELFLSKLVDFAGIRNHGYSQYVDRKENDSRNIAARYILRYINLLPIHYRVKRRLYNGSVRALSIFFKLIGCSWLDSALDKRFRLLITKTVGSRYEESNKELSELIAIDLSKYGYHR